MVGTGWSWKWKSGSFMANLSDGDKVLDIGCANGYSTVQFASQRKIDIRGVDYIPEMVERRSPASG